MADTDVRPAIAYPAHREGDFALADGSTAHVRPIREGDGPQLLAFLRSLSTESLALRFFSAGVDLEAAVRRELDVDYRRVFGVVATVGPVAQVVAHGCYVGTGEGRAEVALAVADRYQGLGLGTLLLGHLVEMAAASGINVLEAEVLAHNHRMIGVLRSSGFPLQVRSAADALRITFPTSFGEEAVLRFEQREQHAAANALRAVLSPRSVAVIGASRRRGTVGGEVFHNLLAYQFAGPVYPVNLAADVVQCVPAYRSVEAIPGPVDLAVVAVPAAAVLDVAEQCGRKGVRALVVLSAGFGETGADGLARQTALLDACRAYGMRLIGPNSIGVANTDPAVRLNATFGPLAPSAGRVGFSSQSGALGLAAMDHAASLGVGISSFVSAGNKADISGNDLLNYWESDPQTQVILLYLESFGNPRKFARIARRVGRSKPIVVVKSGRSAAGARATSSQTGGLLASSDVTVDALFRQAGVIRTDTLGQLFDVALLLSTQPVPVGRRVGIVTNVGGPGVLCADACEAQGLVVPVLAAETQQGLRAALAPEASTANPVDMIATATAAQYRAAVELVGADPNVDAVIAIFLQPLVTRPEEAAAAIAAAAGTLGAQGHAKPVLGVFMSSAGAPRELEAPALRVPSYPFPEAAAIALAHAARYGEWRARPLPPPAALANVRRDEAAALVSQSMGRLGPAGGWLTPDEVAALLSCYELPLVEQRVAATPEAAAGGSLQLGERVALKAIVPGMVHKSEAGAVRLDVPAGEPARRAAQQMAERLSAGGTPPAGFLVQPMVPAGVELIVGVVHDPQFGPVVACGAGGVMAEVLRDVAVGLTPLAPDEATGLLRGLRSYALLTGFRGREGCDLDALRDVLVRVAAMADDLPQLAELDCNPVVALPAGAAIVDARVRLAPADPPRPLGARR